MSSKLAWRAVLNKSGRLFLCFLLISNPIWGKTPAFDIERIEQRRGTFWTPLFSLALPGLDQFLEGQNTYGGIYLGAAAAGAAYAHLLAPHDGRHGHTGIGLYLTAGALSTYHAFRSAVRTRQPHGEFPFLVHEESPSEIALAAFDIQHLQRPTTIFPLLVALGLGFVGFSARDRVFYPGQFTVGDAYFASAMSYTAGTWEELAFRGWLMPNITQWTGSSLAGNLITATLFGAAHYRGTDFIPWPQLVAGFYFGHVVQQNEWRLGEAIFIHAWYDWFLFLGSFLRTGQAEGTVRLPTLMLSF